MDIFEQTLKIIETEFYDKILEDEHLCQMILDWEEFREKSGYSSDDLKVFVLKDMVIEMKRMLDIRNTQIRSIGCS
jgi:hypothetical protein